MLWGMKNKKVKKTVGIRVLRGDWDGLKKLAKKERRTLQDMFGVAVNIADKMLA